MAASMDAQKAAVARIPEDIRAAVRSERVNARINTYLQNNGFPYIQISSESLFTSKAALVAAFDRNPVAVSSFGGSAAAAGGPGFPSFTGIPGPGASSGGATAAGGSGIPSFTGIPGSGASSGGAGGGLSQPAISHIGRPVYERVRPLEFSRDGLGAFGLSSIPATGAAGGGGGGSTVGPTAPGPMAGFGLEGDILRPTEVAAEANPPPGTPELPLVTYTGILSRLGISPINYSEAVTAINQVLELDKTGYTQLAIGAGLGFGTVAIGAMNPVTLLAIVYYSPYALKFTGAVTAKIPALTKSIYDKLKPILMELYDSRTKLKIDTLFSYIIKGGDTSKVTYEHILSKLSLRDEMRGVKDRRGNNDLWTAASAAQVANNSTITSAISLFKSYSRLAAAYPRPTDTDGASLVAAIIDADECNFIKNFFLFNYWLHKKYAARAQLRLFAGAIEGPLLDSILTQEQTSFLGKLASLFKKTSPIALIAANTSRMGAGGSDFAGLINKEDWRIMNSVAANILANSGIVVCGDFIRRIRTCMTVREVGAADIRVADGGEELYDDIIKSINKSAAPNRTGGGVNADEALGRLTSRTINRDAQLQEQAEAGAEKRRSEHASAAAQGILGGAISFSPATLAAAGITYGVKAAASGAKAAGEGILRGVGIGVGGTAGGLLQLPSAPGYAVSAGLSGVIAAGKGITKVAQTVADPVVAGVRQGFGAVGGPRAAANWEKAATSAGQTFVPPFNMTGALQQGDLPGGSGMVYPGVAGYGQQPLAGTGVGVGSLPAAPSTGAGVGVGMNMSPDPVAESIVARQAEEQARQASGSAVRIVGSIPSKFKLSAADNFAIEEAQKLANNNLKPVEVTLSNGTIRTVRPSIFAIAAAKGGARRTRRSRPRKHRKTHKHRSTHKQKARRVRFSHTTRKNHH